MGDLKVRVVSSFPCFHRRQACEVHRVLEGGFDTRILQNDVVTNENLETCIFQSERSEFFIVTLGHAGYKRSPSIVTCFKI